MRPTILVVDDDAATRKMIETALEGNGYRVVTATTASEALDAIQSEELDLVLLDLILPDGDGVEVCRQVRQYSGVSIIMVTAKRDLTDRLAGLDAGADDYVTKPLSIGELLARISALLRRKRMRDEEQAREICHGAVCLRQTEGVASVEGREVKLSDTEAEILRILVEAEGEPLSLREIAREVWGEDETDLAVLETHIANIRHKLEEAPESPRHLITTEDGAHHLA
ncbi:MAG: response regulator transcription factor [Armatimonadota bacterium]|nr:response regulator transcription factor [Armatimonadota bacterium]